MQLQAVELSLDGYHKNLREELTTHKSDFNQMHVETRSETLEVIEAARFEFQSPLNKSSPDDVYRPEL
jgi:hypothetical protein